MPNSKHRTLNFRGIEQHNKVDLDERIDRIEPKNSEICLLLHAAVPAQVNVKTDIDDFNMNLAQLMRVNITSVFKKTQNLLNNSQPQFLFELFTPHRKIGYGFYSKITWSF